MPPVELNRTLNLMTRTLVVDKLRIAFQERLNAYPAVAASMSVAAEMDYRFADRMVYTITAFLANIHKQNKAKTTLYTYPSTPWEFYKKMYAPAWFLKRWPVKYTSEDVVTWTEKNFMCPHLVFPPDDSKHILWLMDANDGNYKAPYEAPAPPPPPIPPSGWSNYGKW
jgi:hypothetical protein